ncbi:hypothetical protein XENORESO_010190 [Xenotaenia resolanae]|uniref:Uncharacterized protein n=1 Tax=Xenotaenia resolanae TaxID=208358 RepID=A0ABV0W278_9TELE
MKKITDFKNKGDQTDGGLDRTNELNTFFNRFSSEKPQHPPLQLTAKQTSGLQPNQKILILALPPPSTCVSREVRSSDNCKDYSRITLQVQMVSALESLRPVHSSSVGFCSTSSTLAWPR